MEPPGTGPPAAVEGTGQKIERQVTWSEQHVYHHFAASHASTSDQGYSNADLLHEDQPGCWVLFQQRVTALRHEVLALHYALEDPRTPLLSKVLPYVVLAYALSPIDLIPDFIPILGILDDLILLPFLIWISIALIPEEVMADARDRAEVEPLRLSRCWATALLIILLWLGLLLLTTHWLIMHYGRPELQQYEWAVLAGIAGISCILAAAWAVFQIRAEKLMKEECSQALLEQQQAAAV